MNRANEIIAYLSRSQDSQLIVIAPNAPPIDRTPAGIKIALNQVLDASDVNDTLIALTSRAPSGGAATLGNNGTFCFGIRGVGRFRVTYFSQRGSKIVIIYRLAVTIPSLETVVQDPQLVQMLESRLRSTEGGLLIINGPHPISNSTLAYSLLQQVNRTERRLIYCIERALTYILNHDNSVVIQSELGIDVCGFEDAIHTALILAPDVLYVGDLRLSDIEPHKAQSDTHSGMVPLGGLPPSRFLAGLTDAINSSIFTILSSTSLTLDLLFDHMKFQTGVTGDYLKKRCFGVISVVPQPSGQPLVKWIKSTIS